MNRRLFLASFTSLVAASRAFGGIRFHGKAYNPAPPSVGPATVASGSPTTWNGTPLSGYNGAAILDATTGGQGIGQDRATAKPAAHWFQPDQLRLWQDMTIGIATDAGGLNAALGGVSGIKYVDFIGDCAPTRIIAPTLLVDTDARGNTRIRYGYWITLNAAAFQAVSTSGSIRIFAVITANDGTMQVRVLGNDTDALHGDWKQQFYVRATESDFAKTIGPSGADYTTVDAFFNAARTANAEAPKGTFITSGFYEANDGNSGTAGTGNAKGRALLTAANGVTATIGRATPFTPNGNTSGPQFTTAYYWRPGWPGIEFRDNGANGGRLIIDLQNFIFLRCNAICDFNGCRLTNSKGSGVYTYWNAGLKVGFGTFKDDSSSLPAWWRDGVSEYVSFHMAYSWFTSGWKARGLYAVAASPSPHDRTNFVYATFEQDHIVDDFRNLGAGNAAVKFQYTGAGVCTMTVTAGNQYSSGNLAVTANGVTANYVLGFQPNLGNMTWADLKATLDARGDLVTTILSPQTQWGDLGPRWMNPYVNQSITSSAGGTTLVTITDAHGSWFHSTTGQDTENVLHHNNFYYCPNDPTNWTTSIWYGESNLFDVSRKNNSWISATGGGSEGINKSVYTSSHFVSAQNNHEGPMTVHNTSCDAYCLLRNEVYLGIVLDHGAVNGMWENVVAQTTGGGGSYTFPTGSNNLGTVSIASQAAFDACFVSNLAGDIRPTGILLANQASPSSAYDIGGIQRSAGDARGAQSKNAPAFPLFDFATG